MRVTRLDQLLAEIDVADLELRPGGDPADIEIASVTHDSRLVEPGALFCCLSGRRSDGHRHAAEAASRGAVAVLCEQSVDVGVPRILVADTRREMARAAAAFWDHPSNRLDVVGVTGTNGKTTTTWLLRAILEAAGRPTGLIGTLGGALTTPESTELQSSLASMVDAGLSAVAMEVSSHALAQARVEATSFALAIFTNLSRDHLDFHTSMEDYFSVKARLFEPGRTAAAVVNVDDPHGRLLLETAQVPTRPFSLAEVTDVEIGLDASVGTWRGRRLRVPLGGSANLANALAAATAAVALGVDEGDVVQGLASVPPVPGRYEHVTAGQPFDVVVDYAHTPDALEQLLVAARSSAGGRVVVVFGCGGERDRQKRPLMGRVAATLADVIIITSDNPRAEDPVAIADEVVAGADGPGSVQVELDRRAAIHLALSTAGPGDVVLVAGKGHETTQVVGRRSDEFSDQAVVAEELVALGFSSRGTS
ncbi:MAG: UDP-N-acetylmuramoyl-L-alanyl-D-glutamate--2,6-diaminopimelate ligase [Actinomycetota bacterium]|nr:UDP-N-acetylmuramoyl-L-alanyl-D-glutamate--2,6-diaminopimelate ligase [Actinomycetota bacterium]